MSNSDDILPLNYHLEIYENSLHNDPFFYGKAKSPFPVPNLGDHMDSRTFGEAGFKSRRLVVVDVEHIYWVIEGSHLAHKLMIVVRQTNED
jgi:hypothetical protein